MPSSPTAVRAGDHCAGSIGRALARWVGALAAVWMLLLGPSVADARTPAPVRVTAGVAIASTGPRDGELAFVEGGRCVLVGVAPRTRYIPSCARISWVPGSPWVVYEMVSAPPRARLRRYVAEDVADGAAFRLPCPEGGGTDVYAVGVALGPTVAYGCGGTLTLMRLGAQPRRTVYRRVPVLTPRGFAPVALAPTLEYAAVVTETGGVQVFRLPSQSRVPGTFTGRSGVQALAWSTRNSLAIATGSGLGIWHPGSAPRILPQVTNANVLWWAPNGTYLVALSSYQEPTSPRLPGQWQIDAGTRALVLPNSGSPSIAVTEDGRYEWHTVCGAGACQLFAWTTGAVAPRGAFRRYLSDPDVIDVARSADIPIYVPAEVPGSPALSAVWMAVPGGDSVAILRFGSLPELIVTEGPPAPYTTHAPQLRMVTVDHRAAVFFPCVQSGGQTSYCLELALPKVLIEMQSTGLTEEQVVASAETLTLVR